MSAAPSESKMAWWKIAGVGALALAGAYVSYKALTASETEAKLKETETVGKQQSLEEHIQSDDEDKKVTEKSAPLEDLNVPEAAPSAQQEKSDLLSPDSQQIRPLLFALEDKVEEEEARQVRVEREQQAEKRKQNSFAAALQRNLRAQAETAAQKDAAQRKYEAEMQRKQRQLQEDAERQKEEKKRKREEALAHSRKLMEEKRQSASKVQHAEPSQPKTGAVTAGNEKLKSEEAARAKAAADAAAAAAAEEKRKIEEAARAKAAADAEKRQKAAEAQQEEVATAAAEHVMSDSNSSSLFSTPFPGPSQTTPALLSSQPNGRLLASAKAPAASAPHSRATSTAASPALSATSAQSEPPLAAPDPNAAVSSARTSKAKAHWAKFKVTDNAVNAFKGKNVTPNTTPGRKQAVPRTSSKSSVGANGTTTPSRGPIPRAASGALSRDSSIGSVVSSTSTPTVAVAASDAGSSSIKATAPTTQKPVEKKDTSALSRTPSKKTIVTDADGWSTVVKSESQQLADAAKAAAAKKKKNKKKKKKITDSSASVTDSTDSIGV